MDIEYIKSLSIDDLMELAQEALNRRQSVKEAMKRYNRKKAEERADSLGLTYEEYKKVHHGGRKKKIVSNE